MNVILFMCLNTYRKRVQIDVIEETIFNNTYYNSEKEPKNEYSEDSSMILVDVPVLKTSNSVKDFLEYAKNNNITVVDEIYYDEEY